MLIFGNVFWVLKLSESGVPIRLLSADQPERGWRGGSCGTDRGRMNPLIIVLGIAGGLGLLFLIMAFLRRELG